MAFSVRRFRGCGAAHFLRCTCRGRHHDDRVLSGGGAACVLVQGLLWPRQALLPSRVAPSPGAFSLSSRGTVTPDRELEISHCFISCRSTWRVQIRVCVPSSSYAADDCLWMKSGRRFPRRPTLILPGRCHSGVAGREASRTSFGSALAGVNMLPSKLSSSEPSRPWLLSAWTAHATFGLS